MKLQPADIKELKYLLLPCIVFGCVVKAAYVYRKHAAIDPAALKKIIADKLGRTYAEKKQ